MWPTSSAFFVYLDGNQNFASLRTKMPDGSYFTSTNNSISFDYPKSLMGKNNSQIDLYGFENGAYLKSFALRNTPQLLTALAACTTGPVRSLPENTPVRQPVVAKVDSDLPKNEDQLARFLLGGSGSPVDDDGKTNWQYSTISDGRCVPALMTHKARYTFGPDKNGGVIIGIQNKSKILPVGLRLWTRINGIERPMEPYKVVADNVPMIVQMNLPKDILSSSPLKVDVLIEDGAKNHSIWDSFSIRLPNDAYDSLESCYGAFD